MLYSPEAHEALTDEPWNAEKARAAVASIVADAESAFDDGWAAHPRDLLESDDPSTRFWNVYDGGAGVVEALHRLARRSFVELRRDYVPYLERSLEAPSTYPDEDVERSLWMGQTGIRLVLQRVAPSQANLERLSELVSANERDERCELMFGSPGTILAGRELGLDVTASSSGWRGNAMQTVSGRNFSSAAAAAVSVPRTGSQAARGRSASSPTSRQHSSRSPSRRAGSSTGFRMRGWSDSSRIGTVRSACSGATVPRGSSRRSVTCSRRSLRLPAPS